MSNILSKLAVASLISGAGLLGSLAINSQSSALAGGGGYQYEYYYRGQKYYCSEPYKSHYNKDYYIYNFCKKYDGGGHHDGGHHGGGHHDSGHHDSGHHGSGHHGGGHHGGGHHDSGQYSQKR